MYRNQKLILGSRTGRSSHHTWIFLIPFLLSAFDYKCNEISAWSSTNRSSIRAGIKQRIGIPKFLRESLCLGIRNCWSKSSPAGLNQQEVRTVQQVVFRIKGPFTRSKSFVQFESWIFNRNRFLTSDFRKLICDNHK